MDIRKELEDAKKRLEKGRKAREVRREKTKDVDEPTHLVSGSHDEVELKRKEKFGDDE